MQRSARNSTRPWQNSLNRRYQRTAIGITSGWDRKPVDVDSPGVKGKSELYASFQHFRRHHAIPRRNSAPQGTVAVVPLVEHPAGDIVRGSRLKLRSEER